MELVLIPAGEYWRGASPDDGDAWSWEKPRHRVIITRPFYLGRYEVSKKQFALGTGVGGPAGTQDGAASTLPMTGINWSEVQAFLERTGFRLPTEAEWEYACRGGVDSATYGTLDDIAWFGDEAGSAKVRAVGLKKPNGFGLYDMLGNAAERCSDIWREYEGLGIVDGATLKDPSNPANLLNMLLDNPDFYSIHVLRGGSSSSGPKGCRASARSRLLSNTPKLVGFRVARDVP